MVKDIGDWHWSSYRATIGKDLAPDWLSIDWLLSQFSLQRKRARAEYVNFVRAGIGLAPIWDNLRRQIFLGGKTFVDKHQQLIDQKDSLEDIPALQKRANAKPISYYEKKYNNKKQAITQAYLSGGYTLKQIGDHFDRHYTTISRIVKSNE